MSVELSLNTIVRNFLSYYKTFRHTSMTVTIFVYLWITAQISWRGYVFKVLMENPFRICSDAPIFAITSAQIPSVYILPGASKHRRNRWKYPQDLPKQLGRLKKKFDQKSFKKSIFSKSCTQKKTICRHWPQKCVIKIFQSRFWKIQTAETFCYYCRKLPTLVNLLKIKYYGHWIHIDDSTIK